MPPFTTENMIITDVRHLPIVKAYAQKIGLVETIDQMIDTQMDVSPGMAIFAMVLDTLSGRTPLYRLTEFFEDKDTALLLGADIEPERFWITIWDAPWIGFMRPGPRRSSLKLRKMP